jgi:lactobin A/cerein 7B family class IIb bacteriocin
MESLSQRELENINGGGIGIGIILGLGTLITFILGVIDGYVRPLPCRK